ncbi:MAG: hypothetical protein Fur007_17470 [Rhodoferax sp.]
MDSYSPVTQRTPSTEIVHWRLRWLRVGLCGSVFGCNARIAVALGAQQAAKMTAVTTQALKQMRSIASWTIPDQPGRNTP